MNTCHLPAKATLRDIVTLFFASRHKTVSVCVLHDSVVVEGDMTPEEMSALMQECYGILIPRGMTITEGQRKVSKTINFGRVGEE